MINFFGGKSRERNVQLIIATHSPTFIDSAGLDNVLLIDRSFKTPLKAQDVDKLVPLLADRGIALPPAKVMNTLKSRRVLFVEGYDDDYAEFIHRLGGGYKPGFAAQTRGLTVFETTGATQKWPFDAIDGFQKLIGVPLKYVFLSDRDFLTDQQLLDRETRAKSEDRSIQASATASSRVLFTGTESYCACSEAEMGKQENRQVHPNRS